MNMAALHFACLIVAVVLFIVSGIGVPTGRYSLMAFGLAFLAGSFLTG